MKRAILVILPLVATLSCAAFAEDAQVTPYRPSVSNPAQLPTPGQLELELGGLTSKAGATQRDSLPYLLKFAFTDQWGLLLGGDALVSTDDAPGGRARGIGDTTLVLKRALLVDEATAFGMEFSVKLPTARDSIGSGKSDYMLNGIFSKDLGKVHVDANLNFTRMGAIDVGTARTQTGLSASLSMPTAEKWNATGELSGTRRGGVPGTAQLLAALAYSPSRQMTIDFGVAKGLNSASPDWSIFSGVVVPIASFW